MGDKDPSSIGEEPTFIGQIDEDGVPTAEETVVSRSQQAVSPANEASRTQPTLSDPTRADATRADASVATPTPAIKDGEERWIGPYKLISELGQGGMGTVYLAEQHQPVRRDVALKIIRAGMDTHQVVARFETERQALAMMDHTGIARVLDGGATETGLPFFVMELVKGEPITDFCDAHRMTIPERLLLFSQVCNAVQHAHQKGIIHRDLKPTNILVAMQDGTPFPKVIDFGLAKPTDQDLTGEAMLTAHGQILGTPEYMSPEQASMTDLDVDTRADVYALGVILYELLTGSTPLRREALRDCGIIDVLKRIKEEEPQSPSLRVSDSAETIAMLSSGRGVEPKRFAITIKGDLDWIVLKALEKDRSRRYGTATELAADIQRYLDDEPIAARPPSTGYRLHKLIRKNRIAFAFITTVAALLVAGIALSSYLAVWANREAAAARKSAGIAKSEGDRAKSALKNAEVEKQRAQEILAVVTDSFRNISPDEGAVYDMPASEALRRAFDQLDVRLSDDPIARAAVLHTLSSSFSELGQYPLALQTAAEAVRVRGHEFGERHRDTLASERQLSRAFRQSGEYQEALELARDTLKISKDALGPNDPDTLDSMEALAAVYYSRQEMDKAIPLFVETLNQRRKLFGDDAPETLRAQHALAAAHYRQHKWAKAIALHQETLEARRELMGAEHPSTLQSMTGLAAAYVGNGDFDKAVELYRATLATQTRILGADHPDALRTTGTLAATLAAQGNLKEAIPLYEKTLEQQESKLGDSHPDTLWTMHSLATRYYQMSKLDRAIVLYQKTFENQRHTLGDDHPDTLHSMHNLGTMYLNSGVTDRARGLLEECLRLRLIRLGTRNTNTLDTMNNLANACLDAGDTEKAIALLRETIDTRRSTEGESHERTLLAMMNLARAYEKVGDSAELIVLRRKILSLQRASPGDRHRDTLNTIIALAADCLQAGQFDEAIALFKEAVAGRRTTLGEKDHFTRAAERSLAVAEAAGQSAELAEQLGDDHPQTLAALARLASAWDENNDSAKAIAIYQEAVERQTSVLGEDHPDRLRTVFQLADTYFRSGHREQAITLHEEALEKRREVLGDEHDDTFESIRQLALCYQREKEFAKAKPLSETVVRRFTETLGPEDAATLKSMSQLAIVCLRTEEPDRATALENRVLAVRRKQLALARQDAGNPEKALRYAGESEQKYAELCLHHSGNSADLLDASDMAILQATIHVKQESATEAGECRLRAAGYLTTVAQDDGLSTKLRERLIQQTASLRESAGTDTRLLEMLSAINGTPETRPEPPAESESDPDDISSSADAVRSPDRQE